MKNIVLFTVAFYSLTLFAQKSKPTLQNTFVSTTVNEGTKNHFTDNVHKCDLTFTIDADAKLNGEITIKDAATSGIIFKGTMKDNYLIDSAMWYENNNLIKVVNFKEKCCSAPTNYVDPTPKVLSSIKGEKHGPERIFYSKPANVVKEINYYQSGKRQGKQYEYSSNGALVSIRNFKDDKLHDTSWTNCQNKVGNVEIFTNGVPTGVWKKYSATGVLTEATYKLTGTDSTLLYLADGKLQTIICKSSSEGGMYTYREYDIKYKLTKQYYAKDRLDTIGEVMDGMYEEYTNGILILRGEYYMGQKIDIWTTYDKKGRETKSETFMTRDEAMANQKEVLQVTNAVVAVDLFPPALSKATITMTFGSNGKIEKLFKKTQEINWSLDVKSATDYQVICNEETITENERTDVINYITSCISTVKGVRYSHKEVNFITHYKLVFK